MTFSRSLPAFATFVDLKVMLGYFATSKKSGRLEVRVAVRDLGVDAVHVDGGVDGGLRHVSLVEDQLALVVRRTLRGRSR